MEEKEKKEKKTIQMEVPESNQRKLTYEELNQACAELSQQNQQLQGYIKNLVKQNQQLGEANMMKRLDYLFMVLKHKDMFDADFIGDCVKEIKEAIIIPEQEETETKSN